jgi:hypothetical protein
VLVAQHRNVPAWQVVLATGLIERSVLLLKCSNMNGMNNELEALDMNHEAAASSLASQC